VVRIFVVCGCFLGGGGGGPFLEPFVWRFGTAVPLRGVSVETCAARMGMEMGSGGEILFPPHTKQLTKN
jgi:hypothetical protein